MKTLLMLGPDINGKGGVSSVEKVLLDNDLLNSSFNIIFIPTMKESNYIIGFLFSFMMLLKFLFTCIINHIDLVYVHMSHYSSFYRKSIFIMFCLLFRLNYVIHTHGSLFDKFFESRGQWGKNYIKFIFKYAKYIIVLSQNWKDYYMTATEATNIELVYNSVVVPKTNPYRLENKVVLFLGILDARKGIYDILEVLPNVLAANDKVEFILAGNGDVDLIRDKVKSFVNNERVKIPGWVGPEDKEKYLLESAVYILPSYAEGLPMSVLEAMSYGIPVIASNVGGLPELIENNIDGIIIKPGDTPSLEQKLLYLLSNDDIRKNISNSCYNKIKSQYNSDIFVNNLLRLINDSMV